MSGLLIDTSVFIAREKERPVARQTPEAKGRISVATLTELLVGTATASDSQRVLRETTLAHARRFIALPYDEPVAERLATLLGAARMAGRRAGLMDAIIAATALVHDLAVLTHDDDFEVLAELAPELQIARA